MWSYYYTDPNYLAHYGIKGMRWGIRRYQNPDGTLTAAGKAREAMLDAKADVNNHLYGTKAYDKATLKYKNLQRQFKDAKDREALQSKTNAEKTVKELGKTAVVVGATTGGATAASKVSASRAENKFVDNYRSNHPNTKLSRNEILAIRDKELMED